MTDRPTTRLPGKVEKIIESSHWDDLEKVEIAVDGADHLYRELRIVNRLRDKDGKEVRLKPKAEVEITVKAPLEATTAKGIQTLSSPRSGSMPKRSLQVVQWLSTTPAMASMVKRATFLQRGVIRFSLCSLRLH
jgi:hypothetical protein